LHERAPIVKEGTGLRNLTAFITVLCLISGAKVRAEGGPETCTYQTYKWNVHLRQPVEVETVSHPHSDLSPDEIDPATGCTVCAEDQQIIYVPPLAPFRACKKLAPHLRVVLEELVRAGEPIYEIEGYRVGKTRGDPDEEGNRTRFSNHSYGIAIDINPQRNGLYDRCLRFGPHCRLIRGGPWRPGQPGTLTADGTVVKAMKTAGFSWGGEIQGKQKDFMHFSPSGY
jgi:hypothetical protein